MQIYDHLVSRELPIIDVTPSQEARSSLKSSIGYQRETRDCLLMVTVGLVLFGLFCWAQNWMMWMLMCLIGTGLSLLKLIHLDQALKARIEELTTHKTVIMKDEV